MVILGLALILGKIIENGRHKNYRRKVNGGDSVRCACEAVNIRCIENVTVIRKFMNLTLFGFVKRFMFLFFHYNIIGLMEQCHYILRTFIWLKCSMGNAFCLKLYFSILLFSLHQNHS